MVVENDGHIYFHKVQADGWICCVIFWYYVSLISNIVTEIPFNGGIEFLLYDLDLLRSSLLHQWPKFC